MEQIPTLKLSQKISEELKLSRLEDGQNAIVNSHCKRDHLTPTPFDERKNASVYAHNHSPHKNSPNYNQPELERGLQKFRKYENSTSALPNLPTLLESSHYGSTFHGQSQDKLQKGKEQESWFLKMSWALDPLSSYQKNYCPKDAAAFNKENRERPDHNHLAVFELHDAQKRTSNYRAQFQPYAIKKEAEYVIGSKDHLATNPLKNDAAISEYQRRYDSLMEGAKPRDSLGVSIYRKEGVISRQPRLKL